MIPASSFQLPASRHLASNLFEVDDGTNIAVPTSDAAFLQPADSQVSLERFYIEVAYPCPLTPIAEECPLNSFPLGWPINISARRCLCLAEPVLSDLAIKRERSRSRQDSAVGYSAGRVHCALSRRLGHRNKDHASGTTRCCEQGADPHDS